MSDTSVIKVSSKHSPHGEMGQKYLATGIRLGMRLWENEPPGSLGHKVTRRYETIGYVIKGKAELHLEDGQVIVLAPGDSYVVPKGAEHAYRIVEAFTAVEVTSPPSIVHSRDEDEARFKH
jgi:quercetin dioxygenase-like cupin family protein